MELRCYQAKMFVDFYEERIKANYGFAFLLEENKKKFLKVILTNDFMMFDLDSYQNKVIVKYYEALEEESINILSEVFEKQIPKNDFEIPLKLKFPLNEKISIMIEIDNRIKGEKQEFYEKTLKEFEFFAFVKESD